MRRGELNGTGRERDLRTKIQKKEGSQKMAEGQRRTVFYEREEDSLRTNATQIDLFRTLKKNKQV